MLGEAWELLLELPGEGVRSLLCLMVSFWWSLRIRDESLKSWAERRGGTVFPWGELGREATGEETRRSDGVGEAGW